DLYVTGVQTCALPILQQSFSAHQHPGGAVAALQRVMIGERLLQRRQLAVLSESLDRLDRGAVRLDREQHAALREHAVVDDGAREIGRASCRERVEMSA